MQLRLLEFSKHFLKKAIDYNLSLFEIPHVWIILLPFCLVFCGVVFGGGNKPKGCNELKEELKDLLNEASKSSGKLIRTLMNLKQFNGVGKFNMIQYHTLKMVVTSSLSVIVITHKTSLIVKLRVISFCFFMF
uniref:Transmembrane protein n=1 Tax=Trichobilharzia regenti TaxID=157069 RepID=A0AA85IZN5_TRIRE|nr:unnamed protein product [Trichobilharzia regenti]